MQSKAWDKRLLICSSDLNNPERKWCAHRKRVAEMVAEKCNTPCEIWDYNSEFYRLPTRNGNLAKLYDEIGEAVSQTKTDYIFTHNPWGEYGHVDHIFVFNAVVASAKVPVLYTDIKVKSNWPIFDEMPESIKDAWYRHHYELCYADKEWLDKMVNLYKKQNVYTWDKELDVRCNLYQTK